MGGELALELELTTALTHERTLAPERVRFTTRRPSSLCESNTMFKILPILVSLSIYITVYDRRDQCLFDKFSLIASGSN